MNRVGSHVLAALVGGAIVVAGCWWNAHKPFSPAVPGATAKELAGFTKERQDCVPLESYPAPVKKRLGLPHAVAANDSKRVVAASQLPAGDRPRTVTTTVDTATGEAQQWVREDRLPWLRPERRNAVGMAYGWRDGYAAPVARLEGRVDLLQLKALHAGVVGTLDTTGGWFAGVGVVYRW